MGPTRKGLRFLRRAVHVLGLDVRRYTALNFIDHRRARILASLGISTVLDAGASNGRYGMTLRRQGYRGQIISIEPLSGQFIELERVAKSDPDWHCVNCAVGTKSGSVEINVAGNSASSSLLPMTDTHHSAAPESAYIGRELVKVRRLEDITKDVLDASDRVLLKLDVQGFEREVLNGCGKILSQVQGIEIELSFVPLYKGQPLFREMVDCLDDYGFTPVSIERGLTDPTTMKILQVDSIFVRKEEEAIE